jgi:hypothetical protein
VSQLCTKVLGGRGFGGRWSTCKRCLGKLSAGHWLSRIVAVQCIHCPEGDLVSPWIPEDMVENPSKCGSIGTVQLLLRMSHWGGGSGYVPELDKVLKGGWCPIEGVAVSSISRSWLRRYDVEEV